jgi:hypothetical protein
MLLIVSVHQNITKVNFTVEEGLTMEGTWCLSRLRFFTSSKYLLTGLKVSVDVETGGKG